MHRIALLFVILFAPLLAQSNPNTTTAHTSTAANPAEQAAPPPPAPASAQPPPLFEQDGFARTKTGLPVFGSQLFQGDFADISFTGFNPDYLVAVGDTIQVMIWGAMETALDLVVDAKGNIFLPKVGPVSVLGVRNADLNATITEHIRRVYKNNVECYANLRSTQSVKVFVSGFVQKPGLYSGFASDSVLFFLDRAGGIDPKRGSYLNINLIRSGKSVAKLDLYAFLAKGTLPATQFRDGDVILVESRGSVVDVTGLVINSARFEFSGASTPLDHVLNLATPSPDATTVSIKRARNGHLDNLVVALPEASTLTVEPGDVVEVTGRNIIKNVLITYTGEHQGAPQVALPHGTLLSEALRLINPTALSSVESVQLYRKSVAERQKILLTQSLDNLERSILNANSASLEEAHLRASEAETVLAFIERARAVEPKGQILMQSLSEADKIHLEDGDIIHIPARNNLVSVFGEVLYPNTQIHGTDDKLASYVKRAGGFTNKADEEGIMLVKPNGLVLPVGKGKGAEVGPGDEIMVMPKPDAKRLLFAKEISTIIYQIALGARVVIGL